MTYVRTLAIGVSAATLLAASAASASVWVATYTGTVYDSYDSTGVFGPAGSSLDGASFVARYTYNTAVGIRDTAPGSYDQVYGGSYFGVAGPVKATVTINGITQVVAGDYYDFAFAEVGLVEEDSTDNDYNAGNNLVFYNNSYNYAYPAGAAPNLEISLPLTSSNGGGGSFEFSTYDYNTNTYVRDTSGYYATETVQISPAPEPVGWALMLAGFGGLGAALRARRPLAIAAA